MIDFHRDDSKIYTRPKGWILEHVRASKEEFTSEIESCGFQLIAEPEVSGLTENYVLVFKPK